MRAGAEGALRHDRELRAEDETKAAVVAFCDAIVVAERKIGDSWHVLVDEDIDPAIRYEQARWSTRAALDAWSGAPRDHLHLLRSNPLYVHLDNVSKVLVVGGITWFALPYHRLMDLAGLADRLHRFDSYLGDVALELWRLRRGEPPQGVTDAFGLDELSVIAADLSAQPAADDSDPTDVALPRQPPSQG